ncbi:lipopolysaccharide heptosyltransferase II [bacterium]
MEHVKKILLIQTAFLGDIILTIPLIKNLKKIFPDKELTVLTTPVGEKVLKNTDLDCKIIVYDKKGSQKGFLNLIKLTSELREQKFDLAIMPHRSLRTALTAYLARIPHRWGFSNSEGKFLLTKKIQYVKGIHEIDRNLSFLDEFNLSYDKTINFKVDNETEEQVEKILKQNNFLGEKIIGIHPGSVWFTKKWPVKKFIDLIKHLSYNNYKIIIFGDKSDEKIGFEIEKSDFLHSNVLNLIGNTTIKQLIGFIKKISLYITNDSGPMHIAAAEDIPLIAFFGPTVKDIGFFPYSKRAIVLEKDIECRPCGIHGGNKCPKKHFKCMNDISVDEVIEKIKDILG